MGVTTVDQAGLAFIAREEGGQSPDGLYRAYQDVVKVWTIGIGETAGVHPGMVWTREQAYADLERRLASTYVPPILATGYDFNQNELNGFASFAWNLGPGSMQWDVGRYLRAGNVRAAATALLAYNRAGGQVNSDLVGRRRREHDLILTPWVEPDPHHYLRFDTTDRQLGRRRHGNERQIVEEYDRKRARWKLFRGRLGRLRDDMGILAARVEQRMDDDPANNAANHRMWRRDQLEGRSLGRRYV